MSDHTQTLSVELEPLEVEALLANCGAAISWTAIRSVGGDEAFEPALDKLRTALAQPEHQGDEGKADWQSLAQVEREGRQAAEELAEDRRDALVEKNDRIIELERRCVELRRQPPASVLSDEERERLEDIAEHVDWVTETFTKDLRRKEDAAFLRNLASQEQGGGRQEAIPPAPLFSDEGRKRLVRIADELERDHCACDHNSSEYIAGYRCPACRSASFARNLASQEHHPAPLRAKLDQLRSDLNKVDEDYTKLAHGVLDEIEGVLGGEDRGEEPTKRAGRPQEVTPPVRAANVAGEAERLRERLLFELKFDTEPHTLAQVEAAFYRACSPDPQGDQERASEENARRAAHEILEEREAAEAVVRKAIAEFEQRAEACREVGSSPEPFVYAASYLRAAFEKLENGEGLGAGVSDPLTGKELVTVAKERMQAEQPEGGDEEDWPGGKAVGLLARRLWAPFAWTELDEEQQSVKLAGARAHLKALRRYLPATSQDSSGLKARLADCEDALRETEAAIGPLEERARKAEGEASELASLYETYKQRYEEELERGQRERERLRGRADKAEAERDTWKTTSDAQCSVLSSADDVLRSAGAKSPHVDVQANEIVQQSERAETALEELAAELKERVDGAEAGWQANKGEPERRAGMRAYRDCERLAREKAAKLREGER